MTVLRTLYEPVEPLETGHLAVGDGHEIYFECCGNPEAPAAVYLHGGPGGGVEARNRGYFDPQAWQAILFEQRGAGRSRPFAELTHNTTGHLVADMERLRQHCGVERWLVFGGSWGATLALAYAQAHPRRVSGLVLRGVFLGSDAEVQWLYKPGGAAQFYPEAYAAFLDPIPPAERDDLLAAYHRRLFGDDLAAQVECARAWSVWEGTVSRLVPDLQELKLFSDEEFSLSLARIECHYFINQCFMEPGSLLKNAGLLKGLPGVIIQGRYDLVCPPQAAWQLHQAWPGSRLEWVPAAGHSASEPGITDALVRATDSFRS
jgi:proline iminopeptidase